MKIIDTYDSVLALIKCSNGQFDLTNWREYAGAISTELAKKCLEDSNKYDFGQALHSVLNTALASRSKLDKLHASFLAVTRDLDERVAAVFGVDMDVDIILYLGLCNGAGWATRIGSKPTVLLGIEKIIELDWVEVDSMNALIIHELGHLWHDLTGTLYADTKTAAEYHLWQLYQEGIAMYFEQLVLGDFSYYHQDKNGWLPWCAAQKSALFSEYKRRVDTGESTQDFFGDWCSYRGYSDVGYYLGCELVKRMSTKYSLKELVNLGVAEVYAALSDAAKL